eukprot:4007395-Amphidinium_carterae.1
MAHLARIGDKADTVYGGWVEEGDFQERSLLYQYLTSLRSYINFQRPRCLLEFQRSFGSMLHAMTLHVIHVTEVAQTDKDHEP